MHMSFDSFSTIFKMYISMHRNKNHNSYNLQFEIQKQSIILLRRKENANSRMPHYTVISEKLMNDGGSGDATVVSRHYL